MPKRLFSLQVNSQNPSSQSGQIAIIVLLIMVVLLILGLSLARRTSEEILLSGQTEDTTRVFNAAETGIEDALSDASNFEGTGGTGAGTVGDAQYEFSVTPQDQLETPLQENEATTVYLDSGFSGSLRVAWNKEADCNDKAALIVSVYYNNGNDVIHEAYRPDCFASLNRATGFDSADTPPGGQEYADYFEYKSINLSSYGNPVFARIRPVYAETDVYVSGVSAQAHRIVSQGSETNPDGRSEQRAIEVTRTRPAPPNVFDYALYSGGDLEK